MMVSGHAKLAGVIGWPVGHSLSPRLHGFWLDRHGIDGAYLPLAVAPHDLALVLRALPRMGFAGANVTVPHKEAALGLMDQVSDRAKRIGAVNTVVINAAGQLIGDNTDGFGFMENLHHRVPQWLAAAGPACVIGAGGAARAVISALIDAGVPEIRLVNRTRARAAHVARECAVLTAETDLRVVEWHRMGEALDGAALLVNTTTLGMIGQPALDIDLAPLPGGALVTDIVYSPLQTPLLAAAARRGLAVVDGLGMLLHQARPGFAAWFGVEPEVDDQLRAHVLDALTLEGLTSDDLRGGGG